MFIKAKITRILEILVRENFTRQDAVVETIEKKPQILRFEFYDDAIAKMLHAGEGAIVIIEFRIKGNQSNGKVFNNLVGYNIALLPENTPQQEID